ncbi:hypothetical protein [Mesorhizobium sp. M1E.F.Ca.ET.063.01.1.1]|uniref:hypothetical protein n=1 Tax=Mesorhizobium sp. M1E.F.Ca.ET.063.01.1.1 TaxID=2496750 RepID=UPI0016795313|nr:hypothetical protein [Mesorhizobium sp. M1E.F.Ca.ET.063.01.1.1]
MTKGVGGGCSLLCELNSWPSATGPEPAFPPPIVSSLAKVAEGELQWQFHSMILQREVGLHGTLADRLA